MFTRMLYAGAETTPRAAAAARSGRLGFESFVTREQGKLTTKVFFNFH